jgi:hypothetical protein
MFEDREQVRLLKDILRELREFRKELFPSKLTIFFTNGDIKYMSTATITLNPPQTVNGVATETVNGQPYTPVQTDLTWSVQDSTVVSYVTNADGSATFTALKVGVTQVGCVDKTTGNSGTGTLTVTEGTIPGTLVITFSAPQEQLKKV